MTKAQIKDKMESLRHEINIFECYINRFKNTPYDYHCQAGLEALHNELKQLKEWLDIHYGD